MLELIEHHAPALDAVPASGLARGVARAIGSDRLPLPAEVPALPKQRDPAPGRVESAGRWRDARIHRLLATSLSSLAPALREDFEWYLCRGAFFHTDAHYDGVLFGVWCVAGPHLELVFPRVQARLAASPGHLAVFDPFEVHGVLRPGRYAYHPDDYSDADISVFVGFELVLTSAVREAFGVVSSCGAARAVASHTRISAATGAFE